MQMLCFDHLLMRIFETHGSMFGVTEIAQFRRELLTSLASIGTLEGSEEAGVDTILPVEEMIEKVQLRTEKCKLLWQLILQFSILILTFSIVPFDASLGAH